MSNLIGWRGVRCRGGSLNDDLEVRPWPARQTVALAPPSSVLEPEQVAGYCCVPQTPAYTRQTPQTVRSWRQQSARSSTCAGARAHATSS